MKQINLLPWREQARAARRQGLYLALSVWLVIILCVDFVGHSFLASCSSQQEYGNKILALHLTQMDHQLSEMQKIIAKKQILLNKIFAIHSLQVDRSEIIYLMMELTHIVPTGMVLTSIKREGEEIRLEGKSESNAMIASMMRDIEASKWLQHPLLQEIQSNFNSGLENNYFIVSSQIKTRSSGVVEN